MATPRRARWTRFERIIAAIELATSRGATVTWDENIGGRQFDVTVRFTNGPHHYLTLIECKDHKSPVGVEHVDAFVTKARDAKANKAVMVSASGFQSGCVPVAQRHGVDLFRLNERFLEPPGADQVPFEPTLGAYGFVIHFPGARAPLTIPETNNRLDYLLAHGVVRKDGRTGSLKAILDQVMQTIPMPAEVGRPQEMEMPLEGAIMEIPTLLESSAVTSLTFTVEKTMKKFIPAMGMDHHLALKMNTSFEMLDCIANKPVTAVAALDLPIGFNTTFRPGSYYTSMLEQNYYCERVEDGKVWLVLVEGYSHGQLFQARMSAKLDVSKYYVEITELPEILRLQKMYQRFCAKSRPPGQR
jgi:hypothetical protein